MNIVTLNSTVTIPAGSLLSLDHEQAVAREGLLTPVNTKEMDKARANLDAAKAGRAALRRPGVVATTKELDAADAKVAAARAALEKVRGIWRAKVPVLFKGGEAIGFEGNANGREVREAIGAPDPSDEAAARALDAARAEGVAAGRQRLLEEVEAYNGALDAADQAHDAVAAAEAKLEAETDASKKPDLQKAVAAAKEAARQADKAAADLKPVA